MRSLLLPVFGCAVLAASGCSLRSLDELKRCTDKAESAQCPGAGGSGAGAQGGASHGGGVAAASGTAGASGNPVGLAGAGASEAGAAGAAPAAEIVLSYAHRALDVDETLEESKAIRPIFVIKNLSAEPVDVSELSIRYYYTLDNPMAQVFVCDFVDPDEVVNHCDGVAVTFGTLDAAEAKDYAEITLAPPDGATWLIPRLGGDSGKVQLRFRKMDFGLQNQTNDYSFDDSKVDEPEPWDRVTLYRKGVLVWGIEPI